MKPDTWIEPDEIPFHKSKRNRHDTECSIKRREGGCGICGSLNICYQGVQYCAVCEEEHEFLNIKDNIYFSFWDNAVESEFVCDCLNSWTHRKRSHIKVHWFRDIKSIGVGKCLDCGAVQSRFCPNSSNHKCWKKNDKYYCKYCGYQR